jgi:hypothetical protein
LGLNSAAHSLGAAAVIDRWHNNWRATQRSRSSL